jgi:hypothetical protein
MRGIRMATEYIEREETKVWLANAFSLIPTADVQPVKHGEWTAEGNDEYGNYWDECTACRNAVFFPPSVKNDYKYCPHCGAVMDGAE